MGKPPASRLPAHEHRGAATTTSFGGGRRFAGEQFQVDTGLVTLARDPSQRNAWHLLLDGVESSFVDLDDPTVLAFEYMRWFGDVIDAVAPAPQPLRALHLGGAGLTLARWIATTRPGSRQLVAEIDAALVALVRERLPLPKNIRVRIRVDDARAVLESRPSGSHDLVVRDVFAAGVVPEHVRTIEFVAQVARVLAPQGCYLANVADTVPMALIGAEVAAALACFAHVLLVYEPAVVRGRRSGNFVIAAAHMALPVAQVQRAVGGGSVSARVRVGAELAAMAARRAMPRDGDHAVP